MPSWYLTFLPSSPWANRYAVIEAESYEDACTHATARFGQEVSLIYGQSAWDATNWAGHTLAQRAALHVLTAQEEEGLIREQSPADPD